MIEAVTAADSLIAVTPIFTTSYSGLFKTFFDMIDHRSLTDQPVVIGATDVHLPARCGCADLGLRRRRGLGQRRQRRPSGHVARPDRTRRR
jgi:multimeric flavodoxin WrbA